MYIENSYYYFHDFKRPVKCAMIKFKIAIENGRSLKLRQTRQVVGVCLCITLHSINTKLEAFGPLLDLLMGLREGLGKGRAEMKGSGEMEKQEGLQDLK